MLLGGSLIRKLNMQILTLEQQAHRNMRMAIMAAMETGNAERARTLLNEYGGVASPEASTELRHDVVASYGIDLD
jgi:hypothetical protein